MKRVSITIDQETAWEKRVRELKVADVGVLSVGLAMRETNQTKKGNCDDSSPLTSPSPQRPAQQPFRPTPPTLDVALSAVLPRLQHGPATSRSPTTTRTTPTAAGSLRMTPAQRTEATTTPLTALPVPSLRLTRRTMPTSSTWSSMKPIATPAPYPPLPMMRRTLPHHHDQRSLRYNVGFTYRQCVSCTMRLNSQYG